MLPSGRRLRARGNVVPRLSDVVLGLGAAATSILLVVPGPATSLVILTLVAAGSVAAILTGVALYRPAWPLPWYLLAFGQLAVAVNWVLDKGHVVLYGKIAPPGQAADWFWFASSGFLLAALFVLLYRREHGWGTFVDTAIIFAAAALAVSVFFVEGFLRDESFSAVARGVQSPFVLLDVAVLATAVRLVLTTRVAGAAYRLVIAAVFVMLTAELARNWLFLTDTSVARPWYEIGWLLFSVLAAAAALHPSMRTLFEARPRAETKLQWPYVIAMAAASLAGPAVLVADTIEHTPINGFAIAAGTATLGMLVVIRMSMFVAETARFSRQLAEQNERLLELDRLKDSFVASVSHEFRTPLTSISGFLDVLTEGEAGALTGDQHKYLGIIRRNAKRLHQLVDDLLFVAQVDAGKFQLRREGLDLSDLAGEAVESARLTAAEAAVTLELEAETAPVSGDSARLAQLLDNLLSNAIKFTPEGGHVRVAVAASNGSAVFEVTDTGIGIPPSDLERLFERFFRSSSATDRHIPGTGLGLAISKAIVDAHGGRIVVSSTEGVGTIFRVVFPLAEPERARAVAVEVTL